MIDYFQKNSLSQSELKKYLKHPRYINKESSEDLYENEDHHFTKGTLLDLLVTDRNAEQIIQNNYFINSVVDISDTLKAIVYKVYDISKVKELSTSCADIIQHVCNDQQYYMNRYKEGEPPKDDWRVKKILDDKNCQNYLDTLVQSQGKIVINQEDLEKAHAMSNAIYHNKYTAPYFELETFYQKPIIT